MDGSRFDQLARGMAAGSTRRTLLKGLGGGVIAALGLARTGGGADADICKTTGKACSKGSQCCSGNCAPAPGKTSVTKSGSVCCPAGQVQGADGACACPTGHIDCGQGCIPGECCPVQCNPDTGVCSDPRCDDGISCTSNLCVNNMCQHPEIPCNDGRGCTANFCDHVLGHCVHPPIGGPLGLCEFGDFSPNGESCIFDLGNGPTPVPTVCDSQFCNEAGLCDVNPHPCTAYGLACTADSECCFGFPCSQGHCWDGVA